MNYLGIWLLGLLMVFCVVVFGFLCFGLIWVVLSCLFCCLGKVYLLPRVGICLFIA